MGPKRQSLSVLIDYKYLIYALNKREFIYTKLNVFFLFKIDLDTCVIKYEQGEKFAKNSYFFFQLARKYFYYHLLQSIQIK